MRKIAITSTKTVKVPKTVLGGRQRPADTFPVRKLTLGGKTPSK